MERLGLKDGEHIESGLVTRSVERAQKKVENLHFESRKHLLEYDDVANEQRKSVYNFRNELLDPNYDIDSRIKQNRLEVLQDFFGRLGIIPGDMANFNLDGLSELMREHFGQEISTKDMAAKEYDSLLEFINSALVQSYEHKMQVLQKEQRSEVERIIYLQVLDNSWREHLYMMDSLKTGIGLRGYNQKDPLVEYKKESYNLFIELITSIKAEALKMLHIVQLQAQEVDAQTKNIINELSDEVFNDGGLGSKKIARNELCPCGSGKKFKQCHGKSGPKKGLLAKV